MTVDSERFFSFESAESLFDIRIDNVPVWERIRYKVWREINEQRGGYQAHTGIRKTPKDYLKGGVLFAKNLAYRNPFFADKTDILFIGHPRRKNEHDGYWWDIYCDPIHEQSNYHYVHLEMARLLQHKSPAKTKNLRYLDVVTYGSTIQRILGLKRPQIPTFGRQRLKEIEFKIHHHFDARIDIVDLTRLMLHQRNAELWLYRRLLDRIDPNLAVVVVSYGRHNFIEACKDRDIPVVELQHGGFGPEHPGYSFPGNRPIETFPDYLFTFGEFWKDRVEPPIPDDNVFAVGYPYLEKQKRRYNHLESGDSVVFISQGTIGMQLTKFALEYARLEDKYEVVIKLHPGEYDRWEKTYPWLIDAPVTVVDGDEPHLYKLLAAATAQVGVNSTVIYEGLIFGNKTYLLSNFRPMRTEHLVEDGHAEFVSTSADLYEAIRTERDPPEVNVTYYFEKNSINNIKAAFEDIRKRTEAEDSMDED